MPQGLLTALPEPAVNTTEKTRGSQLLILHKLSLAPGQQVLHSVPGLFTEKVKLCQKKRRALALK
jgi:hypothetical protein